MTEENVVSKVGELMEALDNIKRYRAFARSLRNFVIILTTTIVVYLVLRTIVINFILPSLISRVLLAQLLLLLIPLFGFVFGIIYVRRKVNSVKTGEWREELSQGFPASLKMLMELNWEKTFDEISEGKLGYAFYGILKAIGYWFLIFIVLERLADIARFIAPIQVLLFGELIPGILAVLIVFLLVGNDLLRRYKELHSLDMLLWELRGLSLEFRRNEFKT